MIHHHHQQIHQIHYFVLPMGATIEDLVVTGENILWYDSNGNMLSQTNILSDNTSYFATQNNSCKWL